MLFDVDVTKFKAPKSKLEMLASDEPTTVAAVLLVALIGSSAVDEHRITEQARPRTTQARPIVPGSQGYHHFRPFIRAPSAYARRPLKKSQNQAAW